MEDRIITKGKIESFKQYLLEEEKSQLTIEKYLRDVEKFAAFAKKENLTKTLVLQYKSYLVEAGYAPRSVNSMLASINSLLSFLGLQDCRVKQLRIQRQTYACREKELTKKEYLQLLKAAEGTELYFVMQTICSTGIRVSELQFFTMEALKEGRVCISCKGKERVILIPSKLKKTLLRYASQRGILQGTVFLTGKGQTMNRSCIWRKMKKLCEKAGVAASKVFPHNLRKLFARSFYHMEKDIAKLADILGHSSIETTRIYIMETGESHRRKLEKLKLVL